MGNTQTLSREIVKKIEIEILNHIDAVCKEHNIKYYLDYGTLLGAIRHKGFIPWDDDIDICMKRDEYERFVRVMSNVKDSRFQLLTTETDPYFFYEFAKVVDSRTRLIESLTIESPNMGVWVDVFPKDNLPRFHRLLKFIVNVLLVFRIFSVFRKFPKHHSILFYPIWCVARVIGFRPFVNTIKKLSIMYRKSDNYVGDLRDLSAPKYFWSREMFDKAELVEFEGGMYPAPQRWHEYLSGLYGDYMILPPEDQRRVHLFNAYYK